MKTEKINNFQMTTPAKAGFKPPSHPHFPDFYHLWLFLAERGKGKTHAVCNLIRAELNYNYHVFWFSGTALHDPTVKGILKGYENSITFIDRFNMEELERVFKYMKTVIDEWEKEYKASQIIERYYKKYGWDGLEEAIMELYQQGKIPALTTETNSEAVLKRRPTFSVVIDDNLGNKLLGSTSKSSNPFNEFVIKHRHYPYYCNVYILMQSYKSLNNTLRQNIQQYCIWPSRDMTVYEQVYKEIAGIFGSLDNFVRLMNTIDKDDHGFLFIDTNTKELRRGFSEKIISW